MTKNLRSIIQIFPKWHYGQIVKGDTRTSPPWNIRKGLIISVIKTSCWKIFYRLVTLRISWLFPPRKTQVTQHFYNSIAGWALFQRRWPIRLHIGSKGYDVTFIFLRVMKFLKISYLDVSPTALEAVWLSNLLLYWELQPVVGYLRLTLVFVWGSALQQEFPFCFSRVFS